MRFNKIFDSNTRIFEQLLSSYTDNAHVLSVCNATMGILGAFYSLGLRDCEIITTPLTWAGALSGLKLLNDKIVYAQIDEPALTLSPESVENLITPATKAVFSADFLGYPAKLDEIKTICIKNDLLLIHDAASSFASLYKGHYSGFFADVCIYSFGRNKAFTTGEGGAIITHDGSIYEKLITHLTHPDRQFIELSHQNMFALNMCMNPLSISYGIKTFEQQYGAIVSHRDKVIRQLKSVGYNNFPSTESRPNFYKPFFCVANGKWKHFSQQALPYKPLSNIELKQGALRDYRVISELCL